MKCYTDKAVLFFLMLIVLASGTAFSQDGRVIRVQGCLGASSPTEKNIESGLWSCFGFAIPVQQKFFLSFDFGHWASGVNGSAETLQDGKVYINPFLVSLQYILKPDRALTPYFFVGGGFVFSNFKLGEVFTIPEISLSQKIENGPGGKIGIGVEMDVTESISFIGEVSYFMRKARAKTTVRDLNSGPSVDNFNVNLSALIFHLGFRYAIR